jgi:hypothetical protein
MCSRGIEFVSFYEFTIGEVMYCICVLGDISFIYYAYVRIDGIYCNTMENMKYHTV